MRRDKGRSISLAGRWEFRAGETGEWKEIEVPGAWEQAGIPNDWEGPGYFRRMVEIPAAWRERDDRRLWLRFAGVSYTCRVWVNGVEVGEHSGAWDAFTFEVTAAVKGEAAFEVVVRIIKPGGESYPVKQTTAGFLPYVCGYLFGGIWQEVSLECTGSHCIPDTLRLTADADSGLLELDFDDGIRSEAEWSRYGVEICDGEGDVMPSQAFLADDWIGEEVASVRRCLQVHVAGENWSPDAPEVYTAVVRLYDGEEVSDEIRLPFGFRTVTVEGDTPLLNGRPFYPRMPLSWGWYPEVGHCDPPEEMLREEFEKIQALGYNGVKCCLWVPSQRFLDLCDEMGMLVWLELPLWMPEMEAADLARVEEEYRAIVRQVRHHPCVVLWTLGCELSTHCSEEFLSRLYAEVKRLTGSPLVRDNSGGGECYYGLLQENADFYDYHFYCDLPFLRNTFDYFLPRWRTPQPWFFGEFCDADAFRDIAALKARNGGELPWWAADDDSNPQGARWDMNIIDQWKQMERQGLFARYAELKEGQRKQTLMHRKFTVERVRSYREMSGYVVTGLRDTPIATAGMFDDFGEFRFSPEEFRRFNADTVLFLDWHRRRNWVHGGDRPSYVDAHTHWSGEALLPRLGISHYGRDATLVSGRWELREKQSNRAVQGGELVIDEAALATGTVRQVATLSFMAPEVTAMTPFVLHTSVRLASGSVIDNEWPLWFTPEPDWTTLPTWANFDPKGRLNGLHSHGATCKHLDKEGVRTLETERLLVATCWTEEIEDFVRRGGQTMVFIEQGDGLEEISGLPVIGCPFWREAMKLFEPDALWEYFPHEGFTDLHFYGLGPDCVLYPDALCEKWPDAAWRPILRRVDARHYEVWDYLTEATFPGGGTLLLSTLRLHGGLGDQPDGLLAHTSGVAFFVALLRAFGRRGQAN